MENFFTTEVIWFLVGLALLLAELVLPGLVILFFGIGAWVTALAVLLFHPPLNVQILIFLVSSLLSLSLLRKVIRKRFTTTTSDSTGDLQEEYVGKTVTALEPFDEYGKGKVSFRGSTWQAQCKQPVHRGQELVIRRFDSIMLFVEPA
jgi:membrane protein implicated in regulation of membrane protease activity